MLKGTKEDAAIKIQRAVRAHLSKPIYVKVKKVMGRGIPIELSAQQALIALNMNQ